MTADYKNIYLKNTEEDFLKELKLQLGENRYQHSRLVLKTALKLAERLEIDQKKVKTAALLHDIAKNKDQAEIKTLVNNSSWEIDDLEMSIPQILHAPAGAVIAEKNYGIKDKEILRAIRFHTLGHPEMGKLAQIIYTADFISEDRSFEGLEKIRKEVFENFSLGLYSVVTNIISYQLERGEIVHPYSNMLRNKLIKEK